MRIKRAIIIPAILTLGVTGSILAGVATHAAAAPASSAHVVAASPNTFMHE
jgi:TRAP-type mannitol/chloroaromatic compound transport system permease large subunit